MRLTFTGQSVASVADHSWLYGVSPGKTGEPGATGGEMSQTRFVEFIGQVCVAANTHGVG
jgi:hypothetical protein